MEFRTVGGREIAFREGDERCLITFFADFDRDSLQELFDSVPDVTIVSVEIDDWNQELSPWDAPPVFGQNGFGHGAPELLQYIEKDLIPVIGCTRYFIGGYSLAGLFSLWACYNTDVFSGCAAASPSVWFPGWDSFITEREIRADHVYLSLGEKESKTRNQVMRTVSDRIELQFEKMKSQMGENVLLEWNPGNHFQDFIERKSKAYNWVASKLM